MRTFKGQRNNSLKDIANKLKTVSTVTMQIDDLIENPDNEYLFGMEGLDRLEESIRLNGFKGSVQAWRLPNGKAELFDGHKRRIAKKQIGDNDILVTLYEMPDNEIDKRIALLYFNLGVRNAVINDNPVYTARQIAYHRETLKMMNFKGEKRKELSRVFSISESQISKYEAILKLNSDLQGLARRNRLGLDNISAISNMSDEKQQLIFDCIVEEIESTGECNSEKISTFIKAAKDEEVVKTDEPVTPVTPTLVPETTALDDAMSKTKEVIVEKNEPDPQTIINENTETNIEKVIENKSNTEKLREKIKTVDNYKAFRKSCDNFRSTINNINDYGDNTENVINNLETLKNIIDNEIQRLSIAKK